LKLADWYSVRCSDAGVRIDVNPPGREAWQTDIPWPDVIRVCYKVEGFAMSDGWYIFTKQRPESYVVPVEADGGEKILDELLKRKLFDAALACEAAMAIEGTFCWPPLR
jgi:hypothetical protein